MGAIGEIKRLGKKLHENIMSVNNSKIFAGLMIITLNVSSKFVNLKLSKTVESYLKNTFSRDILVFAIAWMGTRDIYVAMLITALFVFVMGYLLNEESCLFCLPEEFKDYHLSLLEENISEEDVKKARDVIAKFEAKQQSEKEQGAEKVNPTSVAQSSSGSYGYTNF